MAVYKYIYWREDMPHESSRVVTSQHKIVVETGDNWNGKVAEKNIRIVEPKVVAVGPLVQRVYANVHILRGYTSNSIKDFEDLLEIVRAEVTRKANKHNVECGKVTQSNYCKGFTILTWSGTLVKREFEGWYAAKHCDYYY